MNRKTIIEVALITIATAALGCSTEAQREDRASDEIAKGASDARQRLANAEADYDEQVREAADDRVEEIMRADADLAEDVAEAQNGVMPGDPRALGTPLTGLPVGRAVMAQPQPVHADGEVEVEVEVTDDPPDEDSVASADKVAPADKADTRATTTTTTDQLSKLEYERFAAVKNEDVPTFCARANTRLTVLMLDLEALTTEAREQTVPGKVTGDLEAAAEAIGEARKDIDEVRDATGSRIDDGRLGAGAAINQAQRNLSAVRKALRDLRA